MKKTIMKTLMTLAFTLLMGTLAYTQAPPPPPAGGHGQGTNQSPSGGGAPIGSGIGILLALGAAYGGSKIYNFWKQKEELDS